VREPKEKQQVAPPRFASTAGRDRRDDKVEDGGLPLGMGRRGMDKMNQLGSPTNPPPLYQKANMEKYALVSALAHGQCVRPAGSHASTPFSDPDPGAGLGRSNHLQVSFLHLICNVGLQRIYVDLFRNHSRLDQLR
jgi:hypothetical protein